MDKEQHPIGYAVPLHRSLTQPIFWGGVPRNLLLLEVLVGIIGGIFFKTILVPVLCIAAHYLFRFLGQHDPDFLGVFWRSKDYRPYYYP